MQQEGLSAERTTDRIPGDPGRVHFVGGVHPAGRRWQPHWLAMWLAPAPNWMQRIGRDRLAPRLLPR